MPLVDSHAHLDMYSGDELDSVLTRAAEAGIGTILAIGIGDGPHQMHRALEIADGPRAEGHPAIYASAGIHPQEAANATQDALIELALLVAKPRCIAVGEIGLDYYHVENPLPPVQHAAFIAQLHIAAAALRPIIIHCRTSELATPIAKDRFSEADAWADLLTLLAEHWGPGRRPGRAAGIMHCFSGTVEQARRSLDAGFYLSFAGNVTYPAAVSIREAAAFAPVDRILVETDAPFLAPVPHRGKRNEPALVAHTAATVAALRSITPEVLAQQTTANFHALFPSTIT